MNKPCKICSRYKDALRCCVKGCKHDLCEDCVIFLRIVVDADIYLLPMCHKHAPFVRDSITHYAQVKGLKAGELTGWLHANINPPNQERLMRFISTADNNAAILH